jgi:hypothetical protein
MKCSINVDESIYNALLSSVGREGLDSKFEELLLGAIETKLENYTRQILKFEEKHGLSFTAFERLWESEVPEKKYSYDVEFDFIDWEMLEGEKADLLKLIADCKGHKRG